MQCPSLHYIVLHCTALHFTALCTIIHCTALHCTALHCTALHCTVSLYVSFCIGACISIGREIWCLPYAGFFLMTSLTLTLTLILTLTTDASTVNSVDACSNQIQAVQNECCIPIISQIPFFLSTCWILERGLNQKPGPEGRPAQLFSDQFYPRTIPQTLLQGGFLKTKPFWGGIWNGA